MARILFTIITPVLNRRDFIGAALASVAPADDLEHIVLDGGSFDGTQDVVRRFPHVRLISEPDRGLYDALNRGIALAAGEFVGFLNSDDAYEANAFAVARSLAGERDDAEMLAGGARFVDWTSGKKALPTVNDTDTKRLGATSLVAGVPIINARFFRRSLLDRVGPIDIRFPVAGDRDFLIRCAALSPRIAVSEQVIYRYHAHPGSLTVYAHSRSRQNEHNLKAARVRTMERHGGELGRLYRRWYAWAAAYKALTLCVHERSPIAGMAAGATAATNAPLFPVRAVPIFFDHWRRARRRDALED